MRKNRQRHVEDFLAKVDKEGGFMEIVESDGRDVDG